VSAEGNILRRGDIAIERLTGKKAMVIDVTGPDEVTCRFGDGRLEDRFTFELDVAGPSIWDSLFAYIKIPFLNATPKKRPAATANAPRPRLARQSGAN
jgi:hypothetical protein